MRVLMAGNMYPPHHQGGYELVWRAAVEHVRTAGHEVRVLTTDHREPGVGAPDDPDVHRELRWYWRDHVILDPGPLGAWRLERHNRAVLDRHLGELRPDVVAWWSMGAMSMAMLEQVRRRGIPAVAFVHDDWLDYARRTDAWHRRFGRRSVDFAGAARYVFVSEETRRRAAQSGLALPDTGIAHSGIDPAFLEQRAPEQEWGGRLLYVGRLDPRKGIDTVVEALAELPEATLRVVGGGDDAERARLEALANEHGVAARVELAGPVAREQLPAAYAAADAVVFPVVWSEPWGLVPIEAMAIGRPVIATGRGGSGEYLRDGENCVLFEAGDPRSLAAAVRRLADDAALRARLREAGFALAPQHTEAQLNDAVLAELEARRRSPARPRPAGR